MKRWPFTLSVLLFAFPAIAQIGANQQSPRGFTPGDIKSVDSIVARFMLKYQVPGLSFAIAQNDSTKLKRSYGYADTALKKLLTPQYRFRIASVSKPITATAIMLLIEQGKLHLTDKVFGDFGVLSNIYHRPPYGKWITDITIENLLEHLGGGWGNSDKDPMFLHPEMNQSQLISWTLNSMPLTYQPGTEYHYSNFGFCLLGRVIEKVSGLKYDDFVKKFVLKPAGIKSMEIGGNTLAERKPNEVHYYDRAEDPYDMDERRMDSHGGWIATPSNLIMFLMRVDKFPQKADILKPATLNLMFTAPKVNPGYAMGWAVNKSDNYWHAASLPGEQALIARTHSGFCWAVITNTRKDGDFSSDLDDLMWKIKSAIRQWPKIDLPN